MSPAIPRYLTLAALVAATCSAAGAESTSFRFAAKNQGLTTERRSAPPLALTASDGTGLVLESLMANAVLEGPLAFTELRLSFRNPRPETLEGRFSITLPPGAVLSRFAMKIGDAWQEGEVVERQRARQIFEDFLHRRQDPALLEQEAGNSFSARVFPIPASGVKELILSYSHALERSDQPFRIPLRGLPKIDQLDIRVLLSDRPARVGATSNLGGSARERRVIELHKRQWTPSQDFEVDDSARGSSAQGLRDGNLVVLRLRPEINTKPQEIDGLFVLIDSSASRVLSHASQIELTAQLLAGLSAGAGENTPVAVAVFDQAVKEIYQGPASGFDAAQVRRLRERGALGASDLEGALRWLDVFLKDKSLEDKRLPDKRLPDKKQTYSRLLLITDGIATAGSTDRSRLGDATRNLARRGVQRLDVLAIGGPRDDATLRHLVTGQLPSDGQVIDGASTAPEIARRLTRATRSDLKVHVRGASWVWPEVLSGLQPGDERLVFADLPAELPVQVSLDGKRIDLGQGLLGATERPLLERAWVQSRMDRLLHLRDTKFADDQDVRRALASEVRELSLKHRVLSPFTAFLVLETAGDYQRHGLDQKALADILTVGPAGLEISQRSQVSPPRRPPVPMKQGFNPPPQPSPQPSPRSREAENRHLEAEVAWEDADELIFPMPEAPAADQPGAPTQASSSYGFETSEVVDGASEPPAGAAATSRPSPPPMEESIIVGNRRRDEKKKKTRPWTGPYAQVRQFLDDGQTKQAQKRVERWATDSPGDLLALIALGEVHQVLGDTNRAGRAYASLIDLFPARADLRRHAGQRLETLGDPLALELAIDTYRQAVADRPDHPSGHRLLAWALVRAERWQEAFEALANSLSQKYPAGRFAGVRRILLEDLSLVAAAWSKAEPDRLPSLKQRLRELGAELESEPSLRFVLSWETDANDVDLHVHDGRGRHIYYENKQPRGGGELYADVTTGYGPECFTERRGTKTRAYPYRVKAHYYRRGPMGYGMGTLQVIEHDGRGGLVIESRPFVVMADDAYIELGTVRP